LRVRAARIALYLLLLTLIARCTIGTDTTNVKYRTPNAAQGIVHLCVLTPPRVFAGVATELTAIVGGPPIEADKDGEEEAGRPRELVWLLDLPGQGQVTPLKWHPRLVLRESDIEDEAELRFVPWRGAA
jgi:hypothetical protein